VRCILLQLQVMNSPFNQEQIELLNKLLPTLTEAQQIWLSGYLTALDRMAPPSASGATLQADPPVVAEGSREVTVLFGSQTGNSQGLATDLSRKLGERGFQVTLSSMRDFKPKGLKKIYNLLIVVSTHGEGEPPDNAMSFFEFLHSKRAPQLEDLQFSVLALGDTSYEFFCQTGKDFDQRLEELGGKRICPRTDCDLDYDEPAAAWIESVIGSLSATQETPAVAASAALSIGSGGSKEQSQYSRTSPFQAEVIDNLNLNGRGADRETRHLELSLEGSNFQFEPGDCVGIYPENHPALVDSLIETMGWNSEELVPVNKQGEQRPLRDALLQNYEITVLTKPLLEFAAEFTSNDGLRELLQLGREQDLRNYLDGRDLLDLTQDFSPWQVTPGQFVSILRKLPARLYSIASSFKANPDEVHLTIRTVRYTAHERDRYGVCSVQCTERLESGDSLPIYIHHNPNFKLPANPDTPLIMIGPGTGVAPFRAFMEEREETGAEGKTWLFFGDRHFLTDFLYQAEWQSWLKEGVLTRMDVAFSRDSAEKVYVQQRMLEKSRELYEWLKEGASIYVCGDEKHMAHDVQAALVTILEREGGMSLAEAEAYLTEMQQQKRYQRDVY
jgi:sulfite reductase (NADPH) flavoprotein alpha-component